MRTKQSKKSDWSWWDFDDEGSSDNSDRCDWCGKYVGRRVGSGKFIETSINLHGIKEHGRLCDSKCKELWENHHTQQIIRANELFPAQRRRIK